MKTRNGFVSNSSSSSFVCDVCGEGWSGRNGDYGDIQELRCENNHSFCSECVDDLTVSNYQEQIARDCKDSPEDLLAISKDVEAFIAKEFGDLSSYLLERHLNYDIPETFCPCCSEFNIPVYQLLKYLYKKYNTTKEEIQAECQKEFYEFKDFVRHINS